MNIPEWTLADRLRKARSTTGLGQREFAVLVGVSAAAYAQWEAGNNQPRDVVQVARQVSTATHIPPTWLLGLNDESPRRDDEGSSKLPRLDSNQQPFD